MSDTPCICAICGRRRPRAGMGWCADDAQIWFFCLDPCYRFAPQWMDGHAITDRPPEEP